MKYVFLILLASGNETRTGFFANNESEAREKAVEWAGEDASVGECVERWAVSN